MEKINVIFNATQWQCCQRYTVRAGFSRPQRQQRYTSVASSNIACIAGAMTAPLPAMITMLRKQP